MRMELEGVNMKSTQIFSKLEDLDDRLKNSTTGLQEQLQVLLIAFQEAHDIIKEKLILKSLEFADMEGRYRAVLPAEEDTFEWIFNDPGKMLEKQPDLAIGFVDWLKSGSSIFHIVGKPGSGKSTLMKLLCERDETQECLEEWASAGDKELIFCKFFFWRITTVAEQKTLKGLIRGLLHGVLSQVPSLCRHLFPKQWAPKKGTARTKLHIELGDTEISDAFEILMKGKEILSEFRLCFFIDGLDEFEEDYKLQSETQATLAAKLNKWTTSSDGQVKICVSSRPLLEFTGTFPVSQQVTLQSLTADDIQTLVATRLEKDEHFQNLRNKSEDIENRCDALVQKILDEAEGVFLWVVLVLHELGQALSDESVEVLERIVANAHKELKEFIKTILESIHRHHRQSSYYFLAIIMRMNGILTSEVKAEAALRAAVEAAVKWHGHREYFISLEEGAMFFDAADKGNLLGCDESSALITRDFLNDQEAMKKEKERLLTRCRSLVDVDGNLNIRFTHRSIPESLQILFTSNELEESVQDERVAEVLTWILLADIRRRFKDEFEGNGWDSRRSSTGRLLHMALMHLRMYPLRQDDSERMMRLLYNIQGAIFLALYGTATPPDEQWDDWGWIRTDEALLRRALRLGVFDTWQIHEFTGWLIDTKLCLDKDKRRLLANLTGVVVAICGESPYYNFSSYDFVIDKLFNLGLSLDAKHPPGFVHSGCRAPECQMWYEFVCRELHYGMAHARFKKMEGYLHSDEQTRFQWGALEILLRFGADPDVYLFKDYEEPNRAQLLGPTGEVLFEITLNDGTYSLLHSNINGRTTIPLPRRPSRDGRKFIPLPRPGKISLKEFIEHYKPPNLDKLLKLIQQNMDKKIGHSAPDIPTLGEGTDQDVSPHTSRMGASTPAIQATPSAQPKLVPRKTW
jgi:hypothetical protein